MKRLLALSLFAAGSALATPAAAQDAAGETVNMVIVYGDDACPPPSNPDEITVCARKDEGERYRIPEDLRTSDDPENVAWARRVESYEMVGSFGTLSCSPTGAGGFTGCTQEMLEAAYGERENSSAVRFSQLIAAAREDRLSTIDADAAAEQERVEQIEREYMERLERERAGAVPGEESEALPDPQPDYPGDAPPIMESGAAPGGE